MSDLLRIAEDVLTDHAHATCTQLETCACSMAALHREVRHLRERLERICEENLAAIHEMYKPWHFGTNNEETP